jgi:hypothetical protein
MDNVIEWLKGLIDGDPAAAGAFVEDPMRAAQQAGFQNVTAAQLQTAAAVAAPAAIQGGGNPVHGMQQAVAQSHGIPFVPQQTFAQVAPQADVLSHNATNVPIASNNDVLSPNAGHDVQQGGVNLDFDFSRDTSVGDGGVLVQGNATGDIATSGGVNQSGTGNTAHTGDIKTGDHSPVITGDQNDVRDNSQTAGGDIIQDNEGPVNVIKDNDMSGGGASGGDGGKGGFLGDGGDGGAATGGAGGVGGIHIDNSTHTNTGGGDNYDHSSGNTHDESSNSHNTDSHDYTDNSTHATTTTNVDAGFEGGDISL